MSTYFSGRVHSVVFTDPAKEFYILRMVLDTPDDAIGATFSKKSRKSVAVLGTVPGMTLDIGSWFGFEAKWHTHDKYGRQLKITKAPVIKGQWDPDTAASMLASHGVPESVANRLKDHYGDKMVEALDKYDAEHLQECPGITPFTASHIVERWRLLKSFFKTLEFLNDAGVPKGKVSLVWQTFGEEAEEVLSSNPWRLVEIDGIKFQQADEVALRLGLDMDSPLRLRGAALYSAKTQRGMGHLYLTSADMIGVVQGLVPEAKPKEIGQVLANLHKEELLVIDRTTRPGVTAIYEPWILHTEQEAASLLQERMGTAIIDTEAVPMPEDTELDEGLKEMVLKPYTQSLSEVGPTAEAAFEADHTDVISIAKGALHDWSQGSHMALSETQLRGALNALSKPVSILTGLPGTGKTTTLKAVVSVLKDAAVPFLLCAPTGIAAKRLSSVTNAPASTIHRAFSAKGWGSGEERKATYSGVVGESEADSSDGSGEQWGYDKNNPHPAQVIVCDEFSMVDQHLMYRLLSCTSDKCRLVFVGDAAQLPSVGPGNVLRDLIHSALFPTVSLTEIFRQGELSDIVAAAHATHRGEVPKYGHGKGSDFLLLPKNDEDEVLEIVTKLAAKLYARRENFQVISPRHAGTLGVTNLNQRLREILNPKAPGLQEMRLGNEVVREDDRVMVVKNNYKHGIFNGDVGKIVRLDRRAKEVEIKLHGPPVLHVRLAFKEAPSHLRLAYAMTVHKSQGQEYDTIVLPLHKTFRHQLQRNLFYTAITRAKQKVFLVGQHEALARSVRNNREDARNTLFRERLLEAFTEGGAD